MSSSVDYGTITSNLSLTSNNSTTSQRSLSKLDVELHCSSCQRYYQTPVILPCGHYLCLSCASNTLVNSDEPSVVQLMHTLSNNHNKDQTSPTINSSASSGESDLISVVSETDSGVVFCSPSGGPRNSLGRISVLSTNSNESSGISFGCFCPTCNRMVALLDGQGVDNFPRNYGLEKLIERSLQETNNNGSLQILIRCQLCEETEADDRKVATVWCENCDIFYCHECQTKCHPARGPLMKHVLLSVDVANVLLKKKRYENSQQSCQIHLDVKFGHFCLTCRMAVCQLCLSENKETSLIHAKHNIQNITTAYKNKNMDISQSLKILSEKAKDTSTMIHNLKVQEEQIEKDYKRIENDIKSSIDEIIKQLEDKRNELSKSLQNDRELKQKSIKEFISKNTQNISKSSQIIQFCIEMMKECDSVCFLQNFHSLNEKIANGHLLLNEGERLPTISNKTGNYPRYTTTGKQTNICLASVNKRDLGKIQSSISKFHLSLPDEIINITSDPNMIDDSNKHTSLQNTPSVPRKFPSFIHDECISEGNTITLVWKLGKFNDEQVVNYILELDDGNNGPFRKVYKGKESICTVEGLHFRSIYKARVKAVFANFHTQYSPYLKIQTSNYTWFNLDLEKSNGNLRLNQSNMTLTSQTFEHQVILASTGLSRGIHYWEFTIDKYENGSQPAFGIAKIDCNKGLMLGRDDKSWSIYIDNKRSWFLHNGEHFERTDGGIQPGSTIGIRFDCERGNLSYYLNDEPHGPIAFSELPSGVYYPAVSISKGVEITLKCGLEPPSESEESDESNSDPEIELNKIKETLNII